jgi:class 3 adenylate cyclase
MTVMFADIVRSTDHVAAMGDRRWRDLLTTFEALWRARLERFRGVEINTMGDGFVATFDGPGRALQCASAILGDVRSLGVQVRVGLHTGEVELRGADIGGIAVHIAQRIQALAQPGEALVSSTVKDLVAGSEITFSDRGMHQVKGIPEPWHLYRASEPTAPLTAAMRSNVRCA